MTLAGFNLPCGVVCDPYICVSSDGISQFNKEISRRKKAAENLQSLQGYDPSEFTFSNGVFCDVKENYVVMIVILVDGKRSGKINQTTTKMLFMCRRVMSCLHYVLFGIVCYSSLTS